LSFKRESVVKFDPENSAATEILDKDLKRWRRKLEKLQELKIPWSTICFGIGTAGISITAAFIDKNTPLFSLPAFSAGFFIILIIISIMLWKLYESNIPEIVNDILMDMPKFNKNGEKDES